MVEYKKEKKRYICLINILILSAIIITSISSAGAENGNMTITSDTSFVTVGVPKDVTFTVNRPCGTEPDEVCAAIFPPATKPAIGVHVTLTGSFFGSDITNDDGKVTFLINSSSAGAIIVTASKIGYNNAMTSIPSLPSQNEISTPTTTPTPTPTSTPTLTPTPTPDTNTTIPVPTTVPNVIVTPNTTATPTPSPTSTPTPTPVLNETCETRYVDMGSKSSYDGDSYIFGLNFATTNKSWNATWSVNNTIIKNESDIVSISSINPTGHLGYTNVTAHTINNNCTVIIYSWIWTVIQRPPPQSNDNGGGSSGGGSSSGGGGTSSSLEPYSNIDHLLNVENDIIGGKSVSYSFTQFNFSIYEIDIVAKSNDVDVNVKLEHLKNISHLADKYPAGKIYASENIWINSKRIDYLKVKFKVANSWIEKNNLNKEDIKLLRYDGNWWKLNTNITKNDSSYTYFESLTPLSYVYSISGLVNNSYSLSNRNLINGTSFTANMNNISQNSTHLITKNPPNDIKLQITGAVAILSILLLIYFILKIIVKAGSKITSKIMLKAMTKDFIRKITKKKE